MTIPVAVVDNAEADRYIARRLFLRSEGFGDVREYCSGKEFIKDFARHHSENGNGNGNGHDPVVVLMDISLPGKSGFDIIEEFLNHAESADPRPNVVFLMYTSSEALADREQAASMSAVRGYISKPLRRRDVEQIREIMTAA